jgi:hypothetical protein
MKDITETFSEPFKSIVQGLPEDTPAFVRSLYYWRPVQWPNFDGKITIAGDAAHPMLPCKYFSFSSSIYPPSSFAMDPDFCERRVPCSHYPLLQC